MGISGYRLWSLCSVMEWGGFSLIIMPQDAIEMRINFLVIYLSLVGCMYVPVRQTVLFGRRFAEWFRIQLVLLLEKSLIVSVIHPFDQLIVEFI